MPIYTKKGDKGKTSLFAPKEIRVDKDSLIVEAIGAVDELDSFIGVTKTFSENPETRKLLSEIQENLLTVGSSLAGSGLKISKSKTTTLEKKIDLWDSQMPKLANFVLPGGTALGAHLHYCRSLARRAERRIVALSKVQKLNPNILMYANRLSDFFFVLSRKTNHDHQINDELWVGRKK